MDREKKSIVSREIRSFRDTYRVSSGFLHTVWILIFPCAVVAFVIVSFSLLLFLFFQVLALKKSFNLNIKLTFESVSLRLKCQFFSLRLADIFVPTIDA